MTDQFAFRPRKKSPSVYFNDGKSSFWVQQFKEAKEPNQKLVAAITAAHKAFDKIWLAKDSGGGSND